MVEFLTETERNLLTDNQRKEYDRAVSLCKEEWARGPWGGWADGHDILLSMGWKEHKREEGHRTFVRLSKPLLEVA